MTILIVGGNGQLGRCLIDRLKPSDWKYHSLGRMEMDITNFDQVSSVSREINPSIIINTAAYTNVDQSETDQDLALMVNELGPYNLAKICKILNIPLIHISTDYVFDGMSKQPYNTSDLVNPQSIYGHSKLRGEVKIKDNCDSFLILRTAWLFSEYGNNFLKTILRLSVERDNLKIVSDQIGCPTYAGHLAEVIIKTIPKLLSGNFKKGIFHYAGDKQCSWYDFAKIILSTASKNNYLNKIPELIKVTTEEYITAAKRPRYSVLDSSSFCELFEVLPSNWREVLPSIILKTKLS